jgi:Protein of unknown function (DUF732)
MNDDTQVAPTGYIDEVQKAWIETGRYEAWSEDDTDEDTDVFNSFHSHRVSVALVVLLGVIVSVATWFATTLYREPAASENVVPQEVIAAAPTTPTQLEPGPPMDSDLPTQLEQVPSAGKADIDSRYIAVLKDRGVTSRTRSGAVSAAHTICENHRRGFDNTAIITAVLQANPDVTPQGAVEIVNTAVQTYCAG